MTIDAILEEWRAEAAAARYSKERLKGTAFERLCIAFLTHDPTQRNELEPPVPYADWARVRGLDATDTGIDLVAKVRDGRGWCAIQCKFYGKGKTLPKGAIDSFVTASATKDFSRRLFIDTTGLPWSSNAEAAVRRLEKPFTRITLQQLRESPIDWERYIKDEEVITHAPKTPRPHQETAIAAVVQGLAAKGSRGKLIMACGTGKTYTSLCIAEKLAGQGRRVLYLVPSLALMAQTVRDWSQDARVKLRSFAVCSDSQVGRRRKRNDDNIDMDSLDLAFPATTDAQKLAQEAGPSSPKHMMVIFGTYHSLPVIGTAQQDHGLPDFDLIICDEAHRTAGARIQNDQESPFVQVHRQENVRGDRRLYMTATPKVYAKSARDKANQLNAVLYSMEDEGDFGPVLHELRFGEAIELGLLTDYKVIILTVSEGEVARSVQRTLAQGQLDTLNAGKLLGCWRALSKMDETEFPEDDRLPMRRAIAYCRDIRSSRLIESEFTRVAREYRMAELAEYVPAHDVAVQHVDGTFNALRRGDRLDWLESVQPSDRCCHILTNARCLSEGVDVPNLDAILFMHPRKSQIDVVQAVGRVMRRAPGKRMGYVVLPVVLPSGADPQAVLDRSNTFKVVWQILNAIRSHDERFEAVLNLIESGQAGDRLGIISLADYQAPSQGSGTAGGENGRDPTNGQVAIEFDLPAAIRAKILEKCGSRRYWEEWAVDVADIARRHIERIQEMVTRHDAARELFADFLAELRDDLNSGVTEGHAVEMLAQHMITRPVFEALHGDARFVDHNPVSKGMQQVLDVFASENIDTEAESLKEFYGSVERRAQAANTPLAKQKIIIELYDKFFRHAFPKTAQRLGIVYTPIELVDFVLHSVEAILQTEFGQSLSSNGVQILDPFTGTGTFITRIIQNGLIEPDQLPGKYAREVHANEILLLAYYIAAVNIEAAYHAAVAAEDYERFPGIILTDTFDMQDREDLIASVLEDNSEQRKRQKDAPIEVIVGNPPWSAGQRSQNDAASNQKYPVLDQRISHTYATHSAAILKNSLYDSYIRAIRWASDRIGESGVIGFVTNAGWLEGNAMDGLRKCLAEEFTGIYVLHLRGNQRTQGERSRQEGGKVFGMGSRAPVAITLFVRNPARTGCRIRFHDIGDYLNREEKLAKVAEFRSVHGVEDWKELKPDQHHDWLNQRDPH
ncbi:MAG: DEAD/DEAH box helicase family protein, partial [Bacteroidota bacterium]|nr:DEAD/DEAH box helicase family protein [Bacteroidota bacterium]